MIKYLIIIFVIVLFSVLIYVLKGFKLPYLIRKAEESLDNEEFSKASEIVKKILSKNPNYIPAKYLRTRLLINQGQFLLAISELNTLLSFTDLKKYVNELEIHNHLANLYSQTKNYQKEIEEYKIILTFNPDDVQANYRIGHALFKQNKYKEVKEYLSTAVKLDPSLVDCYLPLGVASFKLAEYEKAEQYLLKSMNSAQDAAEPQFYLGQINMMKKNEDVAVQMFQNARKSRKFKVKSLYFIGEIYFNEGDLEAAIDILEEGLKLTKDRTEESYEYRYLLAECYENLNKIKEAIHHWQKIASSNPSYRSIKLKLDSYLTIMEDANLLALFTSSLEELQPVIAEMISSLHYNIVSKEKISQNEYEYKAYNIKRLNDPPILILFNRTTKEINESDIVAFNKKLETEKYKHGIYITSSKFSIRAKSSTATKTIDLFDSDFILKIMDKLSSRKNVRRPNV